MKIEDLGKAAELNTHIKGIEDFINISNRNPGYITINCGNFCIEIKKEQEHEIINALEKIKSNTIEQLKELGVEYDYR